MGELPPFFFLACSAVDDDSNEYGDSIIGLENVLSFVVTRGATVDDEENVEGMVKQSEGVMPSATRRRAFGRTSFMVLLLILCTIVQLENESVGTQLVLVFFMEVSVVRVMGACR